MPLNRRRFLSGAGAAAVTAAVGFGVIDAGDHSLFERGLRNLGLASGPDRSFPPSGATEQNGTLTSKYMAATLRWTISHPSGPQPAHGIIFCLHGHDSNHRMAFDDIHVPDAAALVGLRVIVAAVDGGADSYWHKRADGTDALAMLLEEFVPLVQGRVGRLPQALMGWSMGGYGSLLAAQRARSAFVAVAPASPAMWLTPGATAPGAFDSPADFYANDVFSGIETLRGMIVAVACGTGDPFYSATRVLVSKMVFPHIAIFAPGYHDVATWRIFVPDQLRALAPAFHL